MTLDIREGGLDEPQVQALLHVHIDNNAGFSPPDSDHTLDMSGLAGPGMSFWSIWDQNKLLGICALKNTGVGTAEIKSMHTAQRARGRGVGSIMVEHLIQVATKRHLSSLELETGSMEGFAPARALYEKYGFVYCDPIKGYHPDKLSIFMRLSLPQE